LSTAKNIDAFLSSRSKAERLQILRDLKAPIPLDLAEELLLLDISLGEKQSILTQADCSSPLGFEHLLTQNLLAWPQDLAVTALNIWQEKSEHKLWHRLLLLGRLPIVPQRVRYTILNHCFHAGGEKLLNDVPLVDGFSELSQVYHGLWMHRLVEWGMRNKTADEYAKDMLRSAQSQFHIENKAIVNAIEYIARFEPKALDSFARTGGMPWQELVHSVRQHLTHYNPKTANKQLMEATSKNLQSLLPPLWLRQSIDEPTIGHLLTLKGIDWQYFGGMDRGKLKKQVNALKGEEKNRVESMLGGLLGISANELLPKDLKQERQAILEGNQTPLVEVTLNDAMSPQDTSRQNFFRCAYLGKPAPAHSPGTEGDVWAQLLDCHNNPEESKLDPLAQAARKFTGVYRICYIDTLAKFKGIDRAALKLLDYIRTEDEDELRAIVRALNGIGTPRAAQELVSALTRPNISMNVQMDICSSLSGQDLSNLQKELRSAWTDLNNRKTPVIRDKHSELLDSVASLLVPGDPDAPDADLSSLSSASSSDQQLDALLSNRIRTYGGLSSEVKRALRTAQFFHIQVSGEHAPDSIDLSPVIDMQYKALELLFREHFEEVCTQLIHQGVLQRKLDVIGYARPIPRQMDEFENYVGGLEIIREIPFFSKFKMRKMLRAICQFRPGRRFTLDGLKAFAIFFLCFGRDQCRYGLNGILDLGVNGDQELFAFCKLLHTLQDARNRAAHEGFHPDASNDIEGIWTSTSEIIEAAFKVKAHLNRTAESAFAPKNVSKPIIQKKVS
jgi:hypothetical protein